MLFDYQLHRLFLRCFFFGLFVFFVFVLDADNVRILFIVVDGKWNGTVTLLQSLTKWTRK